MLEERFVPLFRNDGSQAVRIPREFELAGTRALIRREGDRLVITPVRAGGLVDLLASWQPLDEALDEPQDAPPSERDVF